LKKRRGPDSGPLHDLGSDRVGAHSGSVRLAGHANVEPFPVPVIAAWQCDMRRSAKRNLLRTVRGRTVGQVDWAAYRDASYVPPMTLLHRERKDAE
jgi:hypothetical protein